MEGASEDEGGGDGATFAERLQAYKYYRRFEREEAEPISPSASMLASRSSTVPGLEKLPKPRSALVKYNASVEALERWIPEARKERESSKKLERRTRAEEASIQRQQQHMDDSVRWAKELKRKKDQGNAALASRQNNGGEKGFLGSSSMSSPSSPAGESTISSAEMRAILAEKWIRLLVVISVAQEFSKSIEFAQKDHAGKMRFLAQQSRASAMILMRNPMAQEVVEMDALSRKMKPFDACLTTLTMCFRAKIYVRRQRRSANCMLDCMKNWQFAGRAFVAIRRFAVWIRKLQHWWRKCSKRLRDQRDMICARWERLERASLEEGEAKRQEYMKTGARFWGSSNAMNGLTSEAVRACFVENELRARRVGVLPLLYIWEEDVRKWKNEVEEWQETRAAQNSLGHGASTVFRWPPTRPSYLPPAHPNHQAWGTPCPEDCPGRRGDAEIMEMWRTAKKHPRGWKKVPCRDCPTKLADAKSKSRQRGKASGQKCWEGGAESAKDGETVGAAKASTSPFGEAATDDELRQWGIDASTLPGLERPLVQ